MSKTSETLESRYGADRVWSSWVTLWWNIGVEYGWDVHYGRSR